MPENLKSGLSQNQQAMLDLALACDLKVSDPARHVEIRTRHHAIKTQQDAADYLREVENKIHSRRKFEAPRWHPANIGRQITHAATDGGSSDNQAESATRS